MSHSNDPKPEFTVTTITSVDDVRVIDWLETYAIALDHGLRPDREVLLAAFPRIADELSQCIDILELLAQCADAAGSEGVLFKSKGAF